jgi:predicted phosphodiesterase
MRYGVLSDIHGNLPALDAVLTALGTHRPDAILCAGDLVGYGAFPNECVDRIASVARACVAGNHDLVAIGRQPEDLLDDFGAETSRWTRGVLDDRACDYLAGLPLQLEVDGVVLAHGSLHDPWRYVGHSSAENELSWLAAERPDAGVLVLGHTHAPLAYCEGVGGIVTDEPLELVPGRRYLLNPGAVGQSREALPVARFLVLDLTEGIASFLNVDYDVERYVADLLNAGLPADAHHRPSTQTGPSRGWLDRALGRRRTR